jgi:uncharacterized protein YgfB (UPF0149 family)
VKPPSVCCSLHHTTQDNTMQWSGISVADAEMHGHLSRLEMS